ncbi:MAG: histone deacetylase family protein [Verrucomicrobiia bacterium]
MAIKIITDEKCGEYYLKRHPERPERVLKTIERLKNQTELNLHWESATFPEDSILFKTHSKQLIAAVKNPDGDFDPDTPAYPKIYEHALRAVGGAIKAAESAIKGECAFSLLRPPGHHATKTQAMGFCYFNNIATAVIYLSEKYPDCKIAIYDFDVHHGNGTEDIVLNRPNIAFYSVHEYPHYPGTGGTNVGENCFNYPIAPGSPRSDYLSKLKTALDDLLRFNPSIIAVSAGFDAYENDPLATQSLAVEDYYWLGRQLKETNIPVFCALEGGYSGELPELIFAFLRGLNEKN